MKKYFIYLFILFFCLPVPSEAGTVRFIQVTDVHLTQNNYTQLKKLAADINKNYKNADFVIFTGDNIDKPSWKDLKTFLLIVKKIKLKTYVLLGNHDVAKYQNLDKAFYMRSIRFILGRYHPDVTNFVFRKKGLVFIVMDGVKQVFPAPNGYYKEAELVWLERMLTKYKNKKIVIFQHFPLLEAPSRGHNTYKKEEYLRLLENHDNVLAVISGHFHTDAKVKINGIYHIVTQNFSNGSCYKIIDIDVNKSLIRTYLAEDD